MNPLHPRLKRLAQVSESILEAAHETAKSAAKYAKERRKKNPGAALRPGPDTPLWNELAAAAEKLFKRRGEKAVLARTLGISRQRLHKLLVSKTACPDAERTLLLLAWTQARREGSDLV